MKNVNSILSAGRLRISMTLGVAMTAAALIVGTPAMAGEEIEAAGERRYMDYCATCHGADAKGAGPYATMLTKKPSDLTLLSKNNGGAFPFERVFETIDGRDMIGGAHGSEDMPVWGSAWKGTGVASDAGLRGRVLEMLIYLKSIQQ
ncbi:MAG: cytochrome c [Gammaproteobacteria bacterium]|nr:MAG: cytochrome c [Gammaproteobacteria bacterium]